MKHLLLFSTNWEGSTIWPKEICGSGWYGVGTSVNSGAVQLACYEKSWPFILNPST